MPGGPTQHCRDRLDGYAVEHPDVIFAGSVDDREDPTVRHLRTGPAGRAAVVLALPLLLAGCGADFEAQTYQERTVADSTNAAVGAIAVRNVAVEAPERGELHEAGSDVDATLTLTNDSPQDDRLVGATSPAATSVELLAEGSPAEAIDLPRLSTTGGAVSLRLTGLTEQLRPGQYLEITLQFENSGSVTVAAPVATTGEYDEERERSENFHPIGEKE